jgi:hypothetical protein
MQHHPDVFSDKEKALFFQALERVEKSVLGLYVYAKSKSGYRMPQFTHCLSQSSPKTQFKH